MKRLSTLLAALALLLPSTRAAVENLDRFATIPVMENGRILPMDTYARLKLTEFSGRKSLKREGGDREPAVNWLARVLFEPSSTFSNKIFVVDNPEVLEAIGVPEAPKEDHRRYSFEALRPGLDKLAEKARAVMQVDSKKRAEADQEILRVYSAVNSYMSLVSSFTFAQPHPDFGVSSAEVKTALGLETNRVMFSYVELRGVIEAVRGVIEAAKDRPVEQWTPVEQDTFRLAQAMFDWTQRFQGAGITAIPADPHGGKDWLTAWDALALGTQDAALNGALLNIGRLPGAWLTGNQASFDEAADAFHAFIDARQGSHREVRVSRSEVAFNRAALFPNAKVLYIIAFVVAFFAVLTGNRHTRRAALALVALAFVLHTAGLVWRMWLTARPPVTNLYGTFLFVGLMCVLLGLVVERLLRNGVGSFVSAVSGMSLLFIASRYELQGDTMGKMVAVLNSNFWLSTHVVAISMGYAGCFLASIMGVVYLVMRALKPSADEGLALLYRVTLGVLAFGFSLSFLGTMLGGVWADQSWGRFWGWDPKENGALLIVLWCAVIYHCRVAGIVRDVGMAAGAALGGIWVILAWFGTNLLGVGLHSYGFTSGAAQRLYLYVAINLMLTVALVLWVKFSDLKREAAPPA